MKLLIIPLNEIFHDKNFVIATFFYDYRHTAAPVQTIHIVALPTITRGSGSDRKIHKMEENPTSDSWEGFMSPNS